MAVKSGAYTQFLPGKPRRPRHLAGLEYFRIRIFSRSTPGASLSSQPQLAISQKTFQLSRQDWKVVARFEEVKHILGTQYLFNSHLKPLFFTHLPNPPEETQNMPSVTPPMTPAARQAERELIAAKEMLVQYWLDRMLARSEAFTADEFRAKWLGARRLYGPTAIDPYARAAPEDDELGDGVLFEDANPKGYLWVPFLDEFGSDDDNGSLDGSFEEATNDPARLRCLEVVRKLVVEGRSHLVERLMDEEITNGFLVGSSEELCEEMDMDEKVSCRLFSPPLGLLRLEAFHIGPLAQLALTDEHDFPPPGSYHRPTPPPIPQAPRGRRGPNHVGIPHLRQPQPGAQALLDRARHSGVPRRPDPDAAAGDGSAARDPQPRGLGGAGQRPGRAGRHLGPHRRRRRVHGGRRRLRGRARRPLVLHTGPLPARPPAPDPRLALADPVQLGAVQGSARNPRQQPRYTDADFHSGR